MLRQRIKADIKKQHDLYVNKLVGDINFNPKDFYRYTNNFNPEDFCRYTNSQRKDNQGVLSLKRRNGSGLAESETEQAEEFDGQFTDVFYKTSENEVPLLEKSVPHISFTFQMKVKRLNPSKALRPDELHPRVLKELAVELSPVFAHLLQQSLDKGEIPKEWSVANICPLYKKGNRALPCNYHPVSLTCVPCKMLEHIVCTNIMAHFEASVRQATCFQEES